MKLNERVYRCLLHAYPSQFRENYGQEMVRTFLALSARDGWWPAWVRAIADIARSAPGQHVAALGQDAQYAFRKLKSTPGAVMLIALMIGAGTGTNVAIYSMVDALLFRLLPVPDAEEVVTIGRGDGTGEPASLADYLDMRDRNTTFSGLAAAFVYPAQVGEGEHGERRMCGVVTGNYFAVLGIQPQIGRFITESDDGAAGTGDVAVLSHSLWESRYNASPDILGQSITLNDRKFTVIGVAPKSFTGTWQPLSTHVYVPVSMRATFLPAVDGRDASRRQRWLAPIGRLKAGVTPQQAAENLNAIDADIQRRYPELARTGEERRERVLTVAVPRGVSVPHLRNLMTRGAAFMLIVTGLLAVLASVNVTGVLLARAVLRQREIALRMALGASRRKIVRELLTESVLLGLVGAVATVGLAYLSLSFLNNLQQPMSPAWTYTIGAQMDWRVLSYVLAVSLTAALLAGLFPALQATKSNQGDALKEGSSGSRGSRRGQRLRQAMVVGQFTLTVGLLAATGLLVRSLHILYSSEPGFDIARQAYVSLILTNKPESPRRFVEELKKQAGNLPGVISASLMSNPPARIGRHGQRVALSAPGRAETATSRIPAGTMSVDEDFFITVGIPIVQGRAFLKNEVETGRKVAIVNSVLAQRLWPKGGGVGQRVQLGEQEEGYEVVGVARNSKYYSLGEDPTPFIYRPLNLSSIGGISVAVKTAVPPETIVGPMRATVRRMDPALDTSRSGTFQDALDESIWPTRTAVQFLSGFSALALVLTATGLFGLMANHVQQRRHEIGVRMAVGATRNDVTRLFLGRGARLAALGIGFGTMAALGVTRLMRGLLAGVSATDPLTYLGVAALLAAVAVAASWIPARRAARVEPSMALRSE